ncbi:MAG: LysM peptidoglycan-binding domain-containing protein [Bacillota bacterium]
MQVKCDKKEQLVEIQSNLEADINIEGAESIISVMAEARVVATEAMAQEARIDYRITYKVLYVSADGIACVSQDFSGMTGVKSRLITPKSHVKIALNVGDIEYIGTHKLHIKGILEVAGYVINAMEIEPMDKDDNIFAKTELVSVEHIEIVSDQEIIASDNVEIKEGIDSILTYDTTIIVKSATSGAETCAIEGECCTYMMYLTKGNLYSRAITMPFSGECLASNVQEGMETYLDGIADSTTLTLIGGEGGSEVRVEVVVTISGYCVATEEVAIMVDAYSKTQELGCEYEEVLLQDNVCYTGIREKLSGSVRLGDEKKRIRSVLAVSKPSVSGISVINNGVLQVDGVASVSVIYLDEEEHYTEVVATLPFSYGVTRDFECGSGLYAVVKVCDIQARMRHNDEIDIMGEMRLEVYGSKDKYIKFIKSITEFGQLEENDVAISLYIVREGETLFDVAKAMLSDEDTLLQLNPEISLPLQAGEKVLLYRQLD